MVERMNGVGCFEGESLIRRFDSHNLWLAWMIFYCNGLHICPRVLRLLFLSSKVLTIQRSLWEGTREHLERSVCEKLSHDVAFDGKEAYSFRQLIISKITC